MAYLSAPALEQLNDLLTWTLHASDALHPLLERAAFGLLSGIMPCLHHAPRFGTNRLPKHMLCHLQQKHARRRAKVVHHAVAALPDVLQARALACLGCLTTTLCCLAR
jgi:hypothetical protein